MTDFELARALFPKPSDIVGEAFDGSLPPSVVEAVAVSDSEGGMVKVQFLGDTSLLDAEDGSASDPVDPDADYDDHQFAEIPCSAFVSEGDSLLVTVADGAPVDATATGWGDRVHAVASQAEAIATATQQHFWADGNGIHVSTDENDPEGANNILINSLGILLRELTTVLLELSGSGVIVGDQSGTHLQVSSSAVEIISATLQTLLSLSKQTRTIDGTSTDLGAITSAMPLLLEHVGVGTGRLFLTDGTSPNNELLRIVELLGNNTAEIESSANASLGAESKLTATNTDGGVHVAQVSAAASSAGSLVNLQGDEVLVGFAEPIAYVDKTVTVSSTTHGANFTTSVSVAKTGYTPLGVIDWWWDSGTRQNYFNAWGIFTYGNTLYVRLCNLHPSDAASGTFKTRVLYVKDELL